MLYVRGIATRQRYAGIDSVKSSKSILTTALIIRNPTNISAGAVAKPGIAINIGERRIAATNKAPVTTDARPVLPPSATPDELSTNVVQLLMCRSTAPAEVA